MTIWVIIIPQKRVTDDVSSLMIFKNTGVEFNYSYVLIFQEQFLFLSATTVSILLLRTSSIIQTLFIIIIILLFAKSKK